MLVDDPKYNAYRSPSVEEQRAQACVWKEKAFRIPKDSKRSFRWRASALRALQRWSGTTPEADPVAIIVPSLYSVRPGEAMAMGWLNEIDALGAIRQRMISAAKITGWDVFTFHTLHNQDRFFDSMIAAVRETWTREGSLSKDAVAEAARRFPSAVDYHRIQPRLVENLVFQSSLMEWVSRRAEDLPLKYHVVGTALFSALIWCGSISFADAVASVLKVGERWEKAINAMTDNGDGPDKYERFELVRGVIEGGRRISLAVSRTDLPKPGPISRPFVFYTKAGGDAIVVDTPRDAMLALESLNFDSWSCGEFRTVSSDVQGWLATPLHPAARLCRRSSISNYLLACPSSIALFFDHVASVGRETVISLNPDVQNRLRLSRMKVTGP